jgi:hypothetical protein
MQELTVPTDSDVAGSVLIHTRSENGSFGGDLSDLIPKCRVTINTTMPTSPLRSPGLGSPTNRVHENTRPRGKATSRKAQIRRIRTSRRAFKCLPVCLSSDLVYGSWLMVAGSLFATVISIIPLMDLRVQFFTVPAATDVRAFDDPAAWVLSIFAGVMFTLGSYAFVRAFETPPRTPYFASYYHLQTDELLGTDFSNWLSLPLMKFIVRCLVLFSGYISRRSILRQIPSYQSEQRCILGFIRRVIFANSVYCFHDILLLS